MDEETKNDYYLRCLNRSYAIAEKSLKVTGNNKDIWAVAIFDKIARPEHYQFPEKVEL